MVFSFLRKIIYTFVSILLFISCNNEITEPSIKKYVYTLSKSESKEKAKALFEQTITLLSETVIKKTVTNKENYYLIKKNSNTTIYQLDNSFFWNGEITESPFGNVDSYNANFLSKLTFLDLNSTPVAEPILSDTTISNFNANTSFGFTNNNLFGDEIIYSVSSVLIPISPSKIFINSQSIYKRHWIGKYDGINSHLQYSVNIKTDENYFIFDYENNIYWFTGKIIIDIGSDKFVINLIKSTTSFIEFYRDEKFIESYQYKIESYNIFENLLASKDYIFPGSTLVNSGFSDLVGDLHDYEEEYKDGN